jgi:hypothetical protein
MLRGLTEGVQRQRAIPPAVGSDSKRKTKMSTQKAKFALFTRLTEMGFHYDEAAALRRIELTLQSWGEAECGNDRGCIERDETTGKPFFTYDRGPNKPRGRYPVADREAGALRRLRDMVAARNARLGLAPSAPDFLIAYHQGDCRGCNLYLVRRSDVPADFFKVVSCSDGFSIGRDSGAGLNEKTAYAVRFSTETEAKSYAERETISAFYNRGLAVCA